MSFFKAFKYLLIEYEWIINYLVWGTKNSPHRVDQIPCEDLNNFNLYLKPIFPRGNKENYKLLSR